jgi:hypothetical protein
VQNRPTAAYIISLIGGTLGLIVGLFLLVISAVTETGGSLNPGGTIVFGAFGGWCLISSTIVIVASVKLNSDPWEHTKWGTLILVFSIVGIVSALGLIGGILALIYSPQPPSSSKKSGALTLLVIGSIFMLVYYCWSVADAFLIRGIYRYFAWDDFVYYGLGFAFSLMFVIGFIMLREERS